MFRGSMVALLTPMFADGRLDWKRLAALIEWHIDSGTQAIVAMGTTGECATLDLDEHCAVLRFCVTEAAGRIPIIAGAGGNSTAEALTLSTAAYQYGCAATLQVVPYYNKPPQRGLMAHFQRIAEAVPMPHLLYNVPGRTACDLLPETVLELSRIPNIIGIKEASTMARLEALHALLPPDFLILSGEDSISAAAFARGLIQGVISVTANVVPQQMAEMMREPEQALARNEALQALHQALFCECNPLAVKWALHRMGKIESGLRLPLLPLAEAHHATVERALRQAGALN